MPSRQAAGTSSGEGVFQQTGPHEWGSSPGSSTPVSPGLALLGFVGLSLLVGAADAAVGTHAVRHWFPALIRPPGTPPTWLFAAVWNGLYPLIGIAGWLAWRRCGPSRPLRLWGWQLAANAAWVPCFFGLRNPGLALAALAGLLVLLGLTLHSFLRIRRGAALLLLPYALWTGYTAYLTAGFWWLNPF